jgi:hypothetical protein
MREADAAIISIAQQARPKPIGQIDDFPRPIEDAVDARRDEVVFKPVVDETHCYLG